MDRTDYIEPHIMSAIADLVRRPRMPPGLLELSILGGLDFDISVFEDYDRGVTYTYWPDQNGYSPNNNGCTRSSPFLSQALRHYLPRETKDPPKPQRVPIEPLPPQAEKRDKKVKTKAAKKRLKKRRQKERKRLENLRKEKLKPRKNAEENEKTTETKNDKMTTDTVDSSGGAGDDNSQSSSSDSSSCSDDSDECAESESESEELDLTSSFVNKAALIVKRKLEQQEPKHKPDRKEEKTTPVKQEAEPTKNKPLQELPDATKATVSKDMSAAPININPTYEDNVKISKELAMLGNQYASAGRFDMAVKYFTDAIKYNPKEFKLFGNRSFCFEKMQQYEKALTDAQLSLNMAPGWVKGLYRKGRALAGLKRYEEAAGTFKDVLKLDNSCTEAAQELMRVQITQLMECGFTREQSSNALIIHGTLNKAMEVLSKLNQTHTGTIYTVPLLPPASFKENLPRATAVSSGNLRALPSAFQHEHDPSPNSKPLNQNTSNVVPKAAPNPGRTVKSNQEHPKTPPELFPIWVGNLLPSITETMISDLFSSVGKIHSIKVLISKRCAFVNFTTQVHCDQAIRQFHGYELMGNNLALRYPDRIPQGMGMSKAALKAEDLQEIRQRECVHWRMGCCGHGSNCFFRHVPENKGVDRRPSVHHV